MPKSLETQNVNRKRNHHYVWRWYLNRWAKENKVYYVSSKGKIVRNSTKGLARSKDFYQVQPLNREDIEFVRRISHLAEPEYRSLHSTFLSDITIFAQILALTQNSGGESEAELAKLNDIIRSNILEDAYATIENMALPVVQQLTRGNAEILNDRQNLVALCMLMGHQMTRTKKFRNIHANLTKTAFPLERQIRELMAKNAWIVNVLLGLNLGWALFDMALQSYLYIRNETTEPFITSDSPVINIHPELKNLNEYEAPKALDAYMPLSPEYALIINESSTYNHLLSSLTHSDVNSLNQHIYSKSHELVVGSTYQVLENLIREAK